MFYCRVLTGEYTAGRAGIITPPVKNVDTQAWFDSVCDNVISPSMFIVFDDTQAYPEYLVIFRNKSAIPWHRFEWWKGEDKGKFKRTQYKSSFKIIVHK